MFCIPVGITVLSCWAENCSLENWHCEDDKWTWEIAYDREKFRWLLVWLWFTLLSIKSLQFSFWFPLLVTFLLLLFICYKRKMQTIAFWHPRYPFIPCWQTSLRPSSARCHQLPSWIAGRGVRSFRGYFSLIRALAKTASFNREPARPLQEGFSRSRG